MRLDSEGYNFIIQDQFDFLIKSSRFTSSTTHDWVVEVLECSLNDTFVCHKSWVDGRLSQLVLVTFRQLAYWTASLCPLICVSIWPDSSKKNLVISRAASFHTRATVIDQE